MKTVILLTIEHTKDIPELTDQVAGRIYTFLKSQDSTSDDTAEIVQPLEVKEME